MLYFDFCLDECPFFRGKDKSVKRSTEVKEYQCSERKDTTDEKAALKKHIDSIHKKIVRFACNQCDYKHYYKHIVRYDKVK